MRKSAHAVSCLAGALLAAGVVVASASRRGPHDGRVIGQASGPVAMTRAGPVRGLVQNGVDVFLGIPYAMPPVGNLRWRPPQSVAPHEGVLDATHYAATCAQVTTLGTFAGPSSISEDCLYLNVFTTTLPGKPLRLRPVLVWLHGGGNVDGESNDYDATGLATGGPLGTPIVVVTINYRLGLFGFLSETGLNSEGHPWGNYGILDQQAALHWVHDNIAAFGGDPTRVALGGQSAGSQDTSANLISPMAAGLFDRAINQSGPTSSLKTAAAALSLGNAFAAAAGCSNTACLRRLSAARVLQLEGAANANGSYTVGPFVDGTIIPIQPETAWTTGRYNHMPIMGGATEDEALFSLAIAEYFSGPRRVPFTPAQYLADNSARIRAEYPLSDYDGDPVLAEDRVRTDPLKCRDLHVLKLQAASNGGLPIYGYDFTYRSSPFYFPRMPDAGSPTGQFRALAYHTADIQYLFRGWHGGNLGVNLDQNTGRPRELGGAELTLSDQLIAAWTHFVATGDPNGEEVPRWPVLTPTSATLLREDIPVSSETEAHYRARYKCAFWDPPQTYPTS
jgi:para-nitrobenzyl esterase